jgi:hypothetical protein
MSAPTLDVYNPSSAAGVGVELAAASTSLAATVRANGPHVLDLAALEQAVHDRQAIGDALKRVEEFFAPIKQMAHQLHKAICAREATIREPLERADKERQEAIRLYKAVEDRKRRDVEERLAREAQRQREQDAAREAAALETAGEHAAAAAVIAETIATPAPVVALPDPTKGIAKFTRRYLWRPIGDNRLNAERLIPREYLTIDEKKIGAYARAMKGTGSIPGIEFYYVDDPIR